MKRFVVAASAACVALAGCATSSGHIAAGYSSPLLYSGYTCQQLGLEDQMLLTHVASLQGQVDRRATNDKIAMGVGLFVFWPAILLVKGNGEQAAEYARLKGEHEAVAHAATLRGCLGAPRGSGVAALAEPTTYQPYQPSAAVVASAAAPTAARYTESDRMRSGQVMVDNYGRQDGP